VRSLITTLRHNRRAALVAGTVAVAALMLAFVAAAQATDQSSFCGSCHEMTPYTTAWAEGAHSGVACIECHVDAETADRLAHKVTALGEVWDHYFGEPLFPMGTTIVPDERCLACHDGTIDPGLLGFDHESHRDGKTCQTCHASTGHDVPAAALAQAGVLDIGAQAAKDARELAAVGGGAADLAGHITVICSDCHRMAETACDSCHEPGHEPRPGSSTCTDCHAPAIEWTFTHPTSTDCAACHVAPAQHSPGTCVTCHAPAEEWVFTHPASTSCETCHTSPADHYPGTCSACHTTTTPFAQAKFTHPGASAACTTCHTRPVKHSSASCASCHAPGVTWAFRHPGASSTCTSCHSRPSGHSTASCVSCHKPGVNWAFTHPTSTKCASCHTAPANHYGTTCSSCHSPSKPFASAVWTHPGASATCTSCHSRPSGHSTASCVSCHKPGVTWAFTHPTSTSCVSCHRAPSNHYGTTCSSCHTPSRSWGSATFSHASIPGGEHTYRSFSCTTCHPGGYSSYSCLSCHDDNNGGGGDDDGDDDDD